MDILSQMPDDWRNAISSFYSHEDEGALNDALAARYDSGEEIYPPRESIFRALQATPFNDVRAVWLGQDPYHEPGQAMGLAFAVPQGTVIPPSLRNILKEYVSDTGQFFTPVDTTLESWTQQGVLLLNTVLTVRAHVARSHHNIGWEKLVCALVRAVAVRPQTTAFILLGNDAKAFKPMIDTQRHVIFEAAHPSPLSAHRGFFGSKPFSTINAELAERGAAPIDWTLH